MSHSLKAAEGGGVRRYYGGDSFHFENPEAVSLTVSVSLTASVFRIESSDRSNEESVARMQTFELFVRDLMDCDLTQAPLRHQVIQENLRYALVPRVIIDGEWCHYWEDDELGVVVKREPWSLIGAGDNLQEAITDYRQEAKEAAIAMQGDLFEDLTEEAYRMKDTLVQKYLP